MRLPPPRVGVSARLVQRGTADRPMADYAATLASGPDRRLPCHVSARAWREHSSSAGSRSEWCLVSSEPQRPLRRRSVDPRLTAPDQLSPLTNRPVYCPSLSRQARRGGALHAHRVSRMAAPWLAGSGSSRIAGSLIVTAVSLPAGDDRAGETEVRDGSPRSSLGCCQLWVDTLLGPMTVAP